MAELHREEPEALRLSPADFVSQNEKKYGGGEGFLAAAAFWDREVPRASVPERPEALQGDGAGLVLSGVAVPRTGQGLGSCLANQHESSGESGGTKKADEKGADNGLHCGGE